MIGCSLRYVPFVLGEALQLGRKLYEFCIFYVCLMHTLDMQIVWIRSAVDIVRML
jgi:hypothetical protein